MYIADCHCDTLTVLKQGETLWENSGQLDLRRIAANGGGLQFCAVYVDRTYRFSGGIKYTLGIIDRYWQEVARLKADALDCIPILQAGDVEQEHKLALLLAIEDGAALEGSMSALRMYYRLGVRCLTLTWSDRNELGDGVHDAASGGGLSRFGRDAVREMNRLGMLVDVSHLAPRGFWDVMEITGKPPFASHSNAKTICSAPRNLDDEQIKALGARRGVIGINFCPAFLTEDPERADIDAIYRHIAYILDLIGDECVAMGTDFDGIDSTPRGAAGVENMPDVFDYLLRKNFSSRTINNLAYRNVYRLLQETLARDQG